MQSKIKQKNQNQMIFTSRNDNNPNMSQNLENELDRKEFSLNNYNNYSVLKQNFLDTQLKNISINFGFPNTLNSYDYQNSFDLTENPFFEQRNYFYYDKDFKLFKNKSMSKYTDKNNNNKKKIINKKINKNRVFSPQHKIITSLKKKKYTEEEKKSDLINGKNDIYELEVINKVTYNSSDSEGKNKKSMKETASSNVGEESGYEWGEIEQAIFEEKKDLDNNLLNSLCVEIEKENGDRQLKYVEISKDENCLDKDPCLKIKYTIEDKICLGSKTTPVKSNKIKKQKYSSLTKSSYFINNNKSNTNILPKNIYGASLRRENVSEIHLKESKSSQNILSSSGSNEKIFFSGSTVPSSQKYSKYSNAMNNLSNLKENKNIDEIKNLNYRFKAEFKNSEFNDINNNKNKNSYLTEKISGKKQKEKDNLSPDKITNLKYNRNSYDNASSRKKNDYFLEKKEKNGHNAQWSDISTTQKETKTIKTISVKKEETNKEKYNYFTKIEENVQKENEEDKHRIQKRTFVRHKNEEEGDKNLFKEKIIKNEIKENTKNKSQQPYSFGRFEINKEIKEKEIKGNDTSYDNLKRYKFNFIKVNDDNRNKREEKYPKEKEEKNMIERIKIENQEKERFQRIEQEKREKLGRERQEKERQQQLEKE